MRLEDIKDEKDIKKVEDIENENDIKEILIERITVLLRNPSPENIKLYEKDRDYIAKNYKKFNLNFYNKVENSFKKLSL